MGYSERGIINSLFYEINYSASADKMLENLLSRVRFPYIDGIKLLVSDAEVYVEQSFSDFGDSDALFLIDTGKKAISVFLEAKVGLKWTIEKEFGKFLEGTKKKVNSSNLFTQLYHKVRMVSSLRQGGIPELQKGIKFPISSTRHIRKIGKNSVVLRAIKRLVQYLEETFYIVILPEQSATLERFFKNELSKAQPEGYSNWNVRSYGYITWSDIEVFCTEKDLETTLQVFKFNEGQIYSQ